MTSGWRSPPSPRLILGLCLLGAAFTAVALAPTAGAADEVEPNDSLAQASAALLNETAVGQVATSNLDYWQLDGSQTGLLSVDIDTVGGAAYLEFDNSTGATFPTGFEDGGSLHDTYRLLLKGGDTIYLVVTTNNPSVSYTLTFALDLDLTNVTGTAETEPNNVPADAQPVIQDLWADGEAPVQWGDVDWWVFDAPSAGWLWVEVRDIAQISISAYAGATELDDDAGPFSWYTLYQLDAAGPVHLSVMADFGDGSYSIGVRFSDEAAVFWEGPDETENNGKAADANAVTPGQTFHGLGDAIYDRDDFLVVHASAGSLVEVNVTFDYDPLVSAWVTIIGAPDAGDWGYQGDTWYFEATAVFAAAGDLTFNVSVGFTDSTYSVNVTETQLPMFSDGVTTLDELNGDARFGLWFHPANDFGTLTEGVDLTTGGGYMFGETMCAETGVIGDLPHVGVSAGTRFVPSHDDELQVLVASRSMEVSLPSQGEACFRAMSESEDGLLGPPEAEYEMSSPLTGDAAKAMAEIDASGRDGAEGQVALWAVTSGTSATRARNWGATQMTIDSAADILNTAGVVTSISPDAGSTNNNNNNNNNGGGGTTGGGTGGLDLFPVIAGIIILLVIVGVVASAVRARNRAKAQPPAGGAPGTAAYAGGQAAGGQQHVSPPLYRGGPYGSQAQYGAGQGPPAPPRAPGAQYGSSYGSGAPAYGAQAQPAQQPPAQQPPAQQPAAPQGTAPCPGCGSPVAYYAPQCGSCGHQLNWS